MRNLFLLGEVRSLLVADHDTPEGKSFYEAAKEIMRDKA